MKPIATSLFFLLLAATSASTLASDSKTEAWPVRTELPTDRARTAPAATPSPEAQPSTPAEPRKQKRCRQYVKTVGVACRKPASR